jgi:TRAP-type C4-dicarboxylate transport system substrate-binding protein
MRRGSIRTVTLLLAIFVAGALPGLTIKLGSLAPVASPWDVGLKRMAGEWERLSEGRITVKIYSAR